MNIVPMILDLETENHEHLGSKASPFHPENYIVAPAFAVDDAGQYSGEIKHWYFTNKGDADGSDWFRIPEGVNVLVAHNATFELHWLLHRHREEIEAFLKRGGRIFCTQYAEYLLSWQQNTYPDLDSTAPKYGGTHKVDAVKVLWEEGYLTSQIDRELLLEYLAGPEGDIANTRLTFWGQLNKLQELGMLEMFWLRMDSLLYNAYCTFNGLHIDVPTARTNLVEQQARVQELRVELGKLLPGDMPAELREAWNWGSDYHLSALLFGGPIKYKAQVPYDPPKFEQIEVYSAVAVSEENPIQVKYFPVECDGGYLDEDWFAILDGEYMPVRYKAGKNKGQLKIEKIDSDVPKLKWGEQVHTFPGLLTIAEFPTVLREKFLGKRAEFVGKRFLTDGTTPVYSTSSEALEALRVHGYTQVQALTELASLEKDNGTYYENIEYNADGSVKKIKGMLQFVGPDNIVHHQLNGTSTVTTRLSSSKPNL